MKIFSAILQSRDKDAATAAWILSTDGTAVTTRLGTISLNEQEFLVGHDHSVYEKTPIKLEADGADVLVLADGTINGLENAKRMLKLNMLSPATQINLVVLTPLVENSFNYALMTHPIGSLFKASDLEKLYADITSLASRVGIDIISLAGDGDKRLSSSQWTQSNFPHKYNWLTEEEFPFLIGLNTRDQISMQDILHNCKKFRNNAKYGPTRLLLFGDPENVIIAERYAFVASWDVIIHMYNTNRHFKDSVTRSSIAVHDKQDPSLVTELCFTYQLFYDEGYHGMGLLLELIYLMFTAFYDKSLTPADRMVRASIVKTVVMIWREEMTRLKAIGDHFLTRETFKDVIIGVEGLMWYLLMSQEKEMNPIVPWFFSSDCCEQTFAWLRTGQHEGRRTNLDAYDILRGLRKRNRSLELDAAGNHLLEPTVAHTRGKTLIPKPNPTRVFCGKDTNRNELRDALREGVEIAKRKISKHCKFTNCSYVSDSRLSEEDSSEDDYEISSDEDAGPEDMVSWDASGDYVTVDGVTYHRERAKEQFLNDGRTRIPAQARTWRVQPSSLKQSNLSLNKTCAGEGCVEVSVGEKIVCSVPDKGRKRRRGEERNKEKELLGTVFFISLQISSFSTQKSSINHRPMNTICTKHENIYTLWLKASADGKFFRSKRFVRHTDS